MIACTFCCGIILLALIARSTAASGDVLPLAEHAYLAAGGAYNGAYIQPEQTPDPLASPETDVSPEGEDYSLSFEGATDSAEAKPAEPEEIGQMGEASATKAVTEPPSTTATAAEPTTTEPATTKPPATDPPTTKRPEPATTRPPTTKPATTVPTTLAPQPKMLPELSNLNIAVMVKEEEALLEKLNKDRKVRGLSPLVMDGTLRETARYKCKHMIAKNYYAHTAPDGSRYTQWLEMLNYKGSPLGENITYNFNGTSYVYTQWWNSQGHRNLMLHEKATKVGIGIVYDFDTGRYYGAMHLGY